jgi:hypothetical protein
MNLVSISEIHTYCLRHRRRRRRPPPAAAKRDPRPLSAVFFFFFRTFGCRSSREQRWDAWVDRAMVFSEISLLDHDSFLSYLGSGDDEKQPTGNKFSVFPAADSRQQQQNGM